MCFKKMSGCDIKGPLLRWVKLVLVSVFMPLVASLDYDICRKEIAGAITDALKVVAGTEGGSIAIEDIFLALEKPPEPKLGDYALPCFRFAKALRKSPQQIAATLRDAVSGTSVRWIERIDVVGAFLNIFINKQILSKELIPDILNGGYFSVLKEKAKKDLPLTMIEYSQPNTHKEFHVGHIRNVALGDSLVRLYRYCGYKVIAANYPGDEGTHIAKCLWYLQKQKLTPPSSHKGEWLGEVYARASRALEAASGDEAENNKKEVSAVLKAIEKKSGDTYELWKTTRQWSLDSFYEFYKYFGVTFDQYFFESELSEDSQKIVDEYFKKGIFVESQGAIGVDLVPYNMPFLILRKTDGNTLYATKDLVLARRKFEQCHVGKSIYVVATEQNLHFKQVFKTLELMGFEQAKNCVQWSYGLVMLPEGKMSSRLGTSVTFKSLRESIETALDKALEKYRSEWSADELAKTRDLLAIGAVKYGMLATDPIKDVVFNLADWLSFEGNSGPYLMYSYARTAAIVRKGKEAGHCASLQQLPLLTHESEHELIRYLYDFNETVLQACQNYKPSSLAHSLFDMCKVFNRFYTQVSILKAESPELIGARLALVESFSRVLAHGLDLLGIKAPERM
jgi:arginyl-tRNA synthetase